MHPPAHSFADLIAAPSRLEGGGRERPELRPRSWLYRLFIAPFVDMDHRAVWLNEKLGGRW